MKFIKNFKRVYKYSYGYRKYILLYSIMTIITSIIGVLIPTISASLLVNLTEGIWNKVIICTLFIFFINLFNSIINFVVGFATTKFSKLVISKIQIELGKEILKIQLSDIDKHSNGLFIERLTSDASSISSIFTFGIFTFTSIIKDLGITIVIFVINTYIGLFFITFLIIFTILQKIRIKKIDKKDKDFRIQKEKTSGFTTELIRGIRDIKMLNAEKNFIKNIEENINNLNQKNYNISYITKLFWLINDFFRYLFDLLLVILIVIFVKKQLFDIAIGIVIYNYRHQAINLAYSINHVLDYIRNFNLSCTRVFSLVESNEFNKEKFGNIHLDKIEGNFAFHNVSFGYNEKLVLNNINFEVHANEMVAFVGKSGVGKSTIFNLLCKLYEPNSGTITIDGIDINKLDKDSIRGNITIINQSPYIFNMSIRDNLKIVKDDLTEEEMKEACKLACLDEFISTLKDGYDTIIGEGGVNLSGGEKQRLAIARALVQKTEIILFDEATSALDNETQAQIQKSILNMKKEYTILIIAHRLSTIINSDRILFMEDGKISESATHKELLKTNKEYKKLYESEFIEDK